MARTKYRHLDTDEADSNCRGELDPVYVRPDNKFKRIENLYLCRKCNTYVCVSGWREQIDLMKEDQNGYHWL